MTSPTTSALAAEVGVFGSDELATAAAFFRDHGFVSLRGLFAEPELVALEIDVAHQQERLLAGELPERCGTVVLDDPDAVIDGRPFAHYVCHITEVSPVVREAAYHPVITAAACELLGPDAWMLEDDRFGVVYQDARPGPRSGYSRIGWHTDEQSGPHLGVWPSIGFTIHLDATSPENGFLRVLPGSHLGSTEGIPLGFEKVRGEFARYCDRGDVLLHHSALWHSAARATEDGAPAIRRHLRGGWYGGTRLDPGHGVDDFVKNARR